MKKVGIVITLAIVLFCMGTKFNSVAMMSTSPLNEQEIAALNKQLKHLDAAIEKKEKELGKAGRFEEYAVAKELNVLKRKRTAIENKFTFNTMIGQLPIREAISAQECPLRKKFIEFLYEKTTTTIELPIGSSIGAVAFSSDVTKVAIYFTAESVKFWNIATGMQIGNDLAVPGFVYALAFSPDGTKLATGSSSGDAGIWDIASGTLIKNLHHDYLVNVVAWSPDGSKLAAGIDRHKLIMFMGYQSFIRIWDVAQESKIVDFNVSAVSSIGFSPDGNKMLVGSWREPVIAIDTHTWKKINSPFKNIMDPHAFAFSSDEKLVALSFGFFQGITKLFNVSTGKQIGPDLFHENSVRAIAFSPDGKKLFTAYADKNIKIWDIETQLFLVTMNTDQCELLQAFDMMIKREELGKPLMPIQATHNQWHTFTTFPNAVQDALSMYIRAPEKRYKN